MTSLVYPMMFQVQILLNIIAELNYCISKKGKKWLILFVGVRLDRVRGGRQKYKRSPETQPMPITSSPIKKICIDGKFILNNTIW